MSGNCWWVELMRRRCRVRSWTRLCSSLNRGRDCTSSVEWRYWGRRHWSERPLWGCKAAGRLIGHVKSRLGTVGIWVTRSSSTVCVHLGRPIVVLHVRCWGAGSIHGWYPILVVLLGLLLNMVCCQIVATPIVWNIVWRGDGTSGKMLLVVIVTRLWWNLCHG